MRQALDEDVDLLEMVRTPLMLSIVTFVYRGKSSKAFLLQGTPEQRRRQILEEYVRSMLTRRVGRSFYTETQTLYWLSWLAHQMQTHRQSEFYLERMQPDCHSPS